RPIEEILHTHSIRTHRLEFGPDVLSTTTLTPGRELIYHPPHHPHHPVEISVAYYRAAYDAAEYTPTGIAARLRLERSRAIKCPNIPMQMAGSKKVQQALALPGALERFLTSAEAERVRETFVPMYPLSETHPAGKIGIALALDERGVGGYILKPSLEGGGNNIHGEAIPAFLRTLPREEWGQYILMQKIEAPADAASALISFRGLYSGPVISELGVFGTCLWDEEGLRENQEAGFSFKTKAKGVDEMSVVKGWGCFDSPLLVEW
ncbi:MAG: hypothetical protein Q9170_008304, partial [Blastenia crenularia]